MKYILLLACFSACLHSQAQMKDYYGPVNRIYDARTVGKPPYFPFGEDSCRRFYFNHFGGIDSLLSKAVQNGDTARYIRFYFSFIIDKYGVPYEQHFERVAYTSSPTSQGARTIGHFSDDKRYFEDAVKKMMYKSTIWKPALYNMVPVDCRVVDYFQFWVGLNPPPAN